MINKKININYILLLISLFLIEISNFGQNVIMIKNINNYLFELGLLIGLINSIFVLINLKLNIKKLLLVLSLSILSVLIKYKTGDNLLIEMMILFISSLNTSFDKIIKADLIFKIILFLFISLSHLLGLTVINNFVENGKVLYSFGFKNPNTTGFYLILMFLEYLYIIKDKISIKKIFLPIVICLYLIYLTNSRTALLGLVLFILIYMFFSIFKKHFYRKNKKIYLVYLLFVILSLLSLYITILYVNGSALILELDKILSARIWIQSYYYKLYSISIFGNNLNYVYTIDNVYMRLLLNFGYIGTLFYSIIYGFMFKVSIKNRDVLFYSLSEWCIIRPGINILLFYFSCNLLKSISKDVT